MNLDPRQTEAFRFVIKTGSFEQAAARLHLTPPASSQRVRALASALDRDPRHTYAFRFATKTGGSEHAAARLHLPPPAISHGGRALEGARGSALVVRSRPCRATATGQRLLQYLKRARLLESDLTAEL